MESCANCTNPVSEKAIQLNNQLFNQLEIHDRLEKDYLAEKLLDAIDDLNILNYEEMETEDICNSLCGGCFIESFVKGLAWLNEGRTKVLEAKK